MLYDAPGSLDRYRCQVQGHRPASSSGCRLPILLSSPLFSGGSRSRLSPMLVRLMRRQLACLYAAAAPAPLILPTDCCCLPGTSTAWIDRVNSAPCCRRSASTSLPGQLVASSLTDLTTARAPRFIFSGVLIGCCMSYCHILFFPFFLLPATPPTVLLLHCRARKNAKQRKTESRWQQPLAVFKAKKKNQSSSSICSVFPSIGTGINEPSRSTSTQ